MDLESLVRLAERLSDRVKYAIIGAMNKERYDLAFGFGIACSCSQSLRRAGLQYLSFPGDWTSAVAVKDLPRPNLVIRADRLCQGLDGFLELEDLRFKSRHPWNGKDIYDNTRTLYTFPHDFPAGGRLADELPKIAAKYARRYDRLVSLIRSSKRVLVARIDYPNGSRPTSVDDCRYARKRLSETFPGVTFDFVMLQPDPDTPFERRKTDRPEPWLTRIVFDYRSRRPGDEELIPDLGLTSAALAAVAEVRDYRSRKERAAHRAAERRKRWAALGATSYLGYLKAKIARHFRKTYDVAFGLGVSCNSSISLRRAGLQHLSFPGDWTAPVWKREELTMPNLVYRTEWFCRGFDGFFDAADFSFVRTHEWNGKDVYANERTHYLFVHDFPAGGDFATELPEVVAKFQRRRDRLVSLIRSAKRVLVLRLDHANGLSGATVEDCEKSRELLLRTFPGVEFDFALFQADPTIPFSRRKITWPRPWLTHVTFDYHDKAHPEDPKLPDNGLIAKVLKKLARVPDYRTPEERAAYATKKARKPVMSCAAPER